MTKRSTHLDPTVSYASVGASQNTLVDRYPPAGFSGHREEVLLGSGSTRFRRAANDILTWGAQRGAGIEVSDIVLPSEHGYRGVIFDGAGNAVRPQSTQEAAYSTSGEPLITAGTTATLSWPSRRNNRRVRVVAVVDEERRAGIVLGTADTNGVVGEEFFFVEQRADDSVRGVVQGFLAAPSAGFLGLKEAVLVRLAVMSSRSQIRSLAPGAGQNS